MAISVAVAIGQAVVGGRPVDSLVIDEDFGSLDEVNRALLVTEHGRLSDEMLNGWRVIVVSHQQDVVKEFTSRYRLSRDGDGGVLVAYNPAPKEQNEVPVAGSAHMTMVHPQVA